MRKRILSLLLALTLVLSAGVFGVIPALAADSCVSVKADAVTTGEVVAGSLLEIKLSDVFEDTDGHTLTYTLTNAAQFSAQTKVKDGSLYVSEKDPGTYTPKVKATCSDDELDYGDEYDEEETLKEEKPRREKPKAGKKPASGFSIFLLAIMVLLLFLLICLVVMLMKCGIIPGADSGLVRGFAIWFNSHLFPLF